MKPLATEINLHIINVITYKKTISKNNFINKIKVTS